MTEQICVNSIREYSADGTVLVVENIFGGSMRKLDVIRELIDNEACKNMVDCGPHKREAVN